MGLSYSVLPHTQEDFSGGQNSRDNVAAIADNEGTLIQNWHINKKGKLFKRGGLTLKGTDQGANKVLGAANFYRGTSNHDLVMVYDTNLDYFDSSGNDWATLDSGFTTGKSMEFETANDVLYMTNGTDNVHSWDRSSTTLNSCLTDEGDGSSDPPHAIALKWHRNYMFYAGDGTNDDRLYVSNLNDPQTVARGTDYFTFEDPIVALGELKDFLVVFGERRIWTLQVVGTTLSDWIITPVNDAIGCMAIRSIQKIDNDLYFLAADGVRSLLLTAEDKVRVGRLSGNVSDIIDDINSSKINQSCSAFFENRYYLFVPTGSSTYPNKGIVRYTNPETAISGWVTITGWSPSVMVVHNDGTTRELYIGEAQADTKFYQAEHGADDNGTNIDADFKTKAFTFGFPDRYKRYYRVDCWAYDTGAYTLTIEQNHDDGGFETLGTLDMETGGPTLPFTLPATLLSVKQVYEAETAISNLSKQIQLRFRNNEATSTSVIHKYTIHYKLRKYGY